MTGDRSPAFGPVSSRSEDAADFSSKGLLPQLIDVLRALTEGQELLSRKVRETRLEHNRHTDPVIEGRRQTGPPDPLRPRTFVGSGPDASIGLRRGPPSDSIELIVGPTSVSGFGTGPWPEQSLGASEPVASTVPEASSPFNPPATIVTHADTLAAYSSESSARTDWLDTAPPGETTSGSLNRDYNFFDELDARLADLRRPIDRSKD
jgi:hypothetical protein